ncbi:MAG TPA: aminotransferase class V-fold PLP-dependent enzyme [Candidatus Baltobacteraceae bacterium]|nr:aminotransferase class V-fold PLP-dependent enzyme [Candidatus Baltobacteraceae bacterium]
MSEPLLQNGQNQVRVKKLLDVAVAHATRYLETVDSRPIATTASPTELRLRLTKPLPQDPTEPEQVINELVRDIDGGILGSTNPRFFGWVIGGTLPVALAADWLTSAWDQSAASNLSAPGEAVVEEVCGDWLKQLLGIPSSASFAFVTGSQAAHTTAFASARHKLLRDRGWNVEERGLAGAPQLRILTTENRHESILRAARLVGIGTNAIAYIPADNLGRIDTFALEHALRQSADAPTIVSLQAGDLNTGIFDPFADACRIAHEYNAWVHVDGAFGLWAATSNEYRRLLDGAQHADSWATDGHKWLNVPYDCGVVFVADQAAHHASFVQSSSYSVPIEHLRNQKDWNPEWSRRGRGITVYAAIRALGRSGIAEIIDRCCTLAVRLTTGIGNLDGAEILVTPTINQGLVRFLSPDGNHDRQTDDIIKRIQAGGVAYFGGAEWHGMRVMRISVCNWATTEHDVDEAVRSVRAALSEQ